MTTFHDANCVLTCLGQSPVLPRASHRPVPVPMIVNTKNGRSGALAHIFSYPPPLPHLWAPNTALSHTKYSPSPTQAEKYECSPCGPVTRPDGSAPFIVYRPANPNEQKTTSSTSLLNLQTIGRASVFTCTMDSASCGHGSEVR